MALPTLVIDALPWFQWMIILALIYVAGVALSFIPWIIPIIKLNPHALSAASQLLETSERGGRWLEPFNAFLAAMFGVVAILLRNHPDPAEYATWKFYAAASFTLVQVAWWERVFIFPIERAILATKNLKADRKRAEKTELEELHSRMDKWGMYHAVRALLPLTAAMIGLAGKKSLDSSH